MPPWLGQLGRIAESAPLFSGAEPGSVPLAGITEANPSRATHSSFRPRDSPAHSPPAPVSAFHQSPTLWTPLRELLLRINAFYSCATILVQAALRVKLAVCVPDASNQGKLRPRPDRRPVHPLQPEHARELAVPRAEGPARETGPVRRSSPADPAPASVRRFQSGR